MQLKRAVNDPPSESGSQDEGESTSDEWVDEEEEETFVRPRQLFGRPGISPAESVASGVLRTTPRKRGSRKASHIANASRKQVPPQYPRKEAYTAFQSSKENDRDKIHDAVYRNIVEGATSAIRYMLDVFAIASRLSKRLISVFLVCWLLAFMIGQASPMARRALAPMCVIPGISRSSICRSPTRDTGTSTLVPKRADYAALAEVQSKAFEKLLQDSAEKSTLPLEIKRAEMATTDLMIRVQVSDLKSKDTLVASLRDFVRDAKKTGRSLQKLSSKVEGAVDSIMAVNNYALMSIQEARANEPSPWDIRALMPWTPPRQSVGEVVAHTFDEAMNVLSNHMARLIEEAEVNLANLNRLEERLTTLNEIMCREDSTISSEKEQLLGYLWTQLGGNRRSLRNFDHHLTLLKGLSEYRAQARMHVMMALQTLHAMSEDMEDMRERVAAPDLMGSDVPAEVHMKSIHMGLERLREGRVRARRIDEDAVNKVFLVSDD